MSYADDVLRAIQRDLTEIRTRLGPAEFAAFEKKRGSLAQANVDAGNDEEAERVGQHIATWLDEVPVVKALLAQTAPELFGEKPPTQQAPARRQAPADRAAASPSPVDRAEPTPLSSNPPSQASPPPPKDGRAAGAKAWTPELLIQIFKEIVTAIIGLTLVAGTIWLMVHAVGLADRHPDPDEQAGSKDLVRIGEYATHA